MNILQFVPCASCGSTVGSEGRAEAVGGTRCPAFAECIYSRLLIPEYRLPVMDLRTQHRP
jgi:hypothetical protein